MASESNPSFLRIVILQGPARQGSFIDVSSGVTIGRSRGDMQIPDPKMSALHGLIVQEAGGGYVLLDQNSANGTYVLNERVSQVHLTQGVEFRLGQTLFLVESTAAESTVHLKGELKLDPKYLKGFEALEAKRAYRNQKPVQLPPLGNAPTVVIQLKPIAEKLEESPPTSIFQIKEPELSSPSIDFEPLPIFDSPKQKVSANEVPIVKEEPPAEALDWRENLKTAIASLGLKRRTSMVDREFSAFDLPVRLKFIAGVETDREVLLGFGPRIVGAEGLDIEIMELRSPDQAFQLIPTDGRVLFKTQFPEQVLFNESPTRETMVNEGDVIRIGNTRILVQFVLPQRNPNGPNSKKI